MPQEINDDFVRTFNIDLSGDEIQIRLKPKSNAFALIVGIIIGLILIFLGVLFIKTSLWDGLIFLALSFIPFLVAYNMNSTGLYSSSELNFKKKEVLKRPKYNFLKERSTRFKNLNGISFATKAISGHTSAYEEGNTDYRKSIILETDQGDINLMTYYSRKEELEDSASKFVDYVRGKLTNMPV